MQNVENARFVRMRTLAPAEIGLRVFTFGSEKFTPARGWVSVSEDAAAYLALLPARPDDPTAPLAFELWEPPPESPVARTASTAFLDDDAEGANAPSGRLLPSDARASAEAREVREAAEGGSPSSLASVRGEGSPPGAVAPDEGAAPPQAHRLPPGDPAPAETHEAREIA